MNDTRVLPNWAQELYAVMPPLVSYKTLAGFVEMSAGSIANLCSEGRGPSGAVLIGRKKLFPKENVISWLVNFAKN